MYCDSHLQTFTRSSTEYPAWNVQWNYIVYQVKYCIYVCDNAHSILVICAKLVCACVYVIWMDGCFVKRQCHVCVASSGDAGVLMRVQIAWLCVGMGPLNMISRRRLGIHLVNTFIFVSTVSSFLLPTACL